MSIRRSHYQKASVAVQEEMEDDGDAHHAFCDKSENVNTSQDDTPVAVQLPDRGKPDNHPDITETILIQANGNRDENKKGCNCRQDSRRKNGSVSMVYKLTDNPPFHFLIFFALQQSFLVISTPLSTTIIVAEVICAQNDEILKTHILSATLFMMGLSTFAMTTFGVRLPIFQGPTPFYILPLFFLKALDEFKCPETFYLADPLENSTKLMAKLDNSTIIPNRDVSLDRINAYGGALIAVGAIHCLIGTTGMVSLLGRLVGPITIVPVVLLFGITIHPVVISFAETHWPTALLTMSAIVVLGLYLEHCDTPVPVWTSSKGFHIVWQPLHRIFSLLLGIIIGWGVCAILTMTGAMSDDKDSKEYLARTDARFDVVSKTDWLLFPYPGKFGMPGFSTAAFVPFLICCILSILDSIGDYNASARVSNTVPPPNYALNRGIAVEGIMSILSGACGCTHATVSFGENIGAMGITRVASRSVFQVMGLIYILFAFLGKFGAFFITIPYSVIGGTQIITFGMFIGVVLSYLETIDLRSQRNLSILGISIFMGLAVPFWFSQNQLAIKTDASDLDDVIRLLLSNPSFIGGALSCFLDNTVPGTDTERGITAQAKEIQTGSVPEEQGDLENSVDVYRLTWLPNSIRKSTIAKFIRIFDTKQS